MKTTKIMKFINTMLIAVFLLGTISTSNAQEKEEKKEIKIKMIKEENGERIEIDTTFDATTFKNLEDFPELEEFLKEHDMEDFNFDIVDIDDLSDMDVEYLDEIEIDAGGEKHIVIIKKDIDGKESNVTIKSGDINWVSDEGEGKNIRIKEGEDGKKTVIIENEDETTKEIVLDGEKGAYMIDDEGEMITLEVEVDDGANMIMIKKNGTAIDLKDLDKSKNMWVYTSDDEPGEGEDVEVFVEVIKKKEGNETIVIKKKVILKTVGEKDLGNFEKSGVDLKPGQDNTLELEKLVFVPNPSDGKFTLKFNSPDSEKIIVQIFDLNGKMVYEETVKNFDGAYNKQIDISSEGQGTYFLKIIQGNKFNTRKIIIE